MSDESDNGPERGSRKRLPAAICSSESSDSDSSFESVPRPKKIRGRNYISDSVSDSDSSIEIVHKRRVKRLNSDIQSNPSPSSSGSDIIHLRHNKNRPLSNIEDSLESEWVVANSDDGDSSIEIVHKRRVKRLNSDIQSNTSTSSSGSDIIHLRRNINRPLSNIEDSSESSESEWVVANSDDELPTTNNPQFEASSETSGGEEREHCPICLLKFKKQDIGTPESCDHSFCLDCILEWAKKVQTCPVDRQPFGIVLKRECLNGKVISQIPVASEAVASDDDVMLDLTFCQLCGSADNEDTMLLCDACDMGYHMLCLDPPLDEIPEGVWMCPYCTPVHHVIGLELDQRNVMNRSLPRTRHMERVRSTIQTNRAQTTSRNTASTTRNGTDVNPSQTIRRRRKKKRAKKYSRRTRIKIVYETNEITGETVAIETKVKQRKRRKRKRITGRRNRAVVPPKTVKKRLAAQLGICKMRTNGQLLPDVRIPNNPNDLTAFQRNEAGIPRLHLFGGADDLLSASGTDSEIETGLDILVRRRRPNLSDAAILRRAVRRKAVVLPSQPSTSNLLDNILDLQTKFHAKDSVLSLNKDGTIKINKKDGETRNNNNNEKDKYKNKNGEGNHSRRINVNSYRDEYLRQRPNYGNNSGNTSTSNSSRSPDSLRNNSDESPRRVSTETTNDLVTTSTISDLNASDSNNFPETTENFSTNPESSFSDSKKDKKSSNKSNSPTNQNSDSDLDIYSDIETVSTSRVEEFDKAQTPQNNSEPATQTDEDANSDIDLIIDTEKQEEVKVDQVSSSVDITEPQTTIENVQMPHSTTEIQNETVSTMTKVYENKEEEDEDSDEEGCPNFSIYSSESINLAKKTDLELLGGDNVADKKENEDLKKSGDKKENEENLNGKNKNSDKNDHKNDNNPINQEIYHPPSYSKDASSSKKDTLGLYSDSEDEELVKMQPFSTNNINNTNNTLSNTISNTINNTINNPINSPTNISQSILNPVIEPITQELNLPQIISQESSSQLDRSSFQLNDIINMTEDISEEERSYTPCLDERKQEGLDGLDTEMISDEEDRNDFDESHEVKTTSDGGEALEINAKESELDFSKPEDFEEGEIIDKLKAKQAEELKKQELEKLQEENNENKNNNVSKESESSNNNSNNSNQSITMATGGANFKKISRNNKDRNYRDKEKDEVRSKSREKEDKENKKSKKKEKRKEIVRYNVRSIIAKPRRDKFGRDKSRRKSASRSSRSRTRSRSRSRSNSRERKQRRRVRSRTRSMERRRSRSRSRQRKRRSKSPNNKKRVAVNRKSSVERKKYIGRNPSPSPPRRRRETERRRGWTRSRSPSFSPEMQQQRLTPSWTPPRIVEQQQQQQQPQRVQPQNLTVILNNDLNNKKKKDKKKRDKRKEVEKGRKRKRDKTPPPSKEVFASGNNILVSVSFNKDTGERDVTKKRRDTTTETASKKVRKEKRKVSDERKKKKKEMATVKPVAIIDLDRSPFRELTPPHQDVIVLTDSENNESNDILLEKEGVCDSSQQAVTPETMTRSQNYSQGPKTPPEPQVKFTLNPKQNQMRAITNPLHDPEELEVDDINREEEEEEELEERSNDNSQQQHKGPNTPPEPPNSPPSSPDAYDPFDPTKSRTPTPVDLDTMNNGGNNREENTESLSDNNKDDDKAHTPPVVADIQPADSQSSTKANSPEKNSPKTDQQLNIGVIINQVIQPQTPTMPQFSSNNLITSTPMSNLITQSSSSSRINILNSTLIAAPIVSTLPRIILPTATKSSPVKVSPNKLPIKSTPIKPMPNKSQNSNNRKSQSSQSLSQSQDVDVALDFDSPYSPGSSDYEDLFEPPTDKQQQNQSSSNKSQQQQGNVNNKNQQQKSPTKQQNTFDVLFGGSPINTFQKGGGKTLAKKPSTGLSGNKYKKTGKTKQIGVKMDEDSFKIMDDVPNSAVEMQVKDKYLKKLNRQERVVEEVKLVLKPHYNKKHINKEEYKDILRRAVPKICHNKSGEINPQKIQNLIEAYVKKVRHNKKVTSSSSSVNPQKV